MNLTVPALSRRIHMLEADLGVTLFQRLPRGLRLTEAGQDYFAALAPAWDQVRAATYAARQRGQRSIIIVSVMPTFAANWLAPRLGGLRTLNGGLDVELRSSPELEDLYEHPELDCAIRLGRGPWPGLDSEPFLPVEAFPVASPGYFNGARLPRSARELSGLPLIGTHHQAEFWQEWFAASDVADVPGACRSFDNLQVVYEAAAAGTGIALGLDPVVRPYLVTGRLLRLPFSPVRLSRQFHLVHRLRGMPPGRAFGQFRAWLLREAETFAALPG